MGYFDEKKYKSNLERVRAFWAGNERHLVSVNSTQDSYRQSFDFNDDIARKAISNLQHQSKLPGINMPTVFADFGTISTAKYWGGNFHMDSTSQNIFIEPVADNIADAISIEPFPVDDSNMDACRGIAAFDKVKDLFKADELWLRMPDLQGVLNTAGLIMNQEELLIAMYSEPTDVHSFLDRISSFLIDYVEYMKKETDCRICGNIWPYTFLPCEIGFAVTEDMMPLLSPDLYKEFGLPYLKKMTDALGPVQIHCCGKYGHHAQNLAAADIDILAVEFHYPFTKIEELEPLANGRTVFIPYLALDDDANEFESQTSYYQHLLESTSEQHRYWFASPEDSTEAIDFAKKHGF